MQFVIFGVEREHFNFAISKIGFVGSSALLEMAVFKEPRIHGIGIDIGLSIYKSPDTTASCCYWLLFHGP